MKARHQLDIIAHIYKYFICAKQKVARVGVTVTSLPCAELSWRRHPATKRFQLFKGERAQRK